MNRKIRLPLIAGILALLSPLPLLAAGIVLEVPIPKTTIGGAAASGGALTALAETIRASGGNLGAPTLGAITPTVGRTPDVHTGAPGEAQAVRAEQLLPADPAAKVTAVPKVGDKGFQQGLERVQEGAGEIRDIAGDKESGEGGGERSAGIGRELFDNAAGKGKSGTGGVTDVSGARRPGRGFGGGFTSGGGHSFTLSLREYGVPMPAVRKLYGILSKKETHPGKQDEIYHGQAHTERVADTLSAILADAPPDVINDKEKALLLVAAALHDVDPKRAPGTPARVAATLEFIDTDPEIGSLIEDLGLNSARGRGQLKTLIKFTDLNLNEAATAEIPRDATQMADENFGPLAGRWSELGQLLAYADRAATYVGTVKFAKQAVDGLAHEARSVSGRATPTNETIQRGRAKFLAPIAADPFFWLLPEDMRGNFLDVLKYYRRLAGPSAPAAKPAAKAGFSGTVGESFSAALRPFEKSGQTVRDAISRTEPSPAADRALTRGSAASTRLSKAAARFLRYKRSMLGSIKPTPKMERDLLTVWMEESGIKPSSALGAGLLAKFYPAEAQKQSAAMAKVSPLYARSADLIVELGGKMGRTTPQVEALIAAYPEIQRIVAANQDEATTRSVIVSVLQRDRVERLTAGYPQNRQGDFLRSMGRDILAPSGKSIEEVTRSGAFAYVDFRGNDVMKVTTGRDPDNQSPDQVFYVTLEPDGRWTIGGYRKNTKRAGTDAEFIKMFKRWLVRGGIQESAFSPSTP